MRTTGAAVTNTFSSCLGSKCVRFEDAWTVCPILQYQTCWSFMPERKKHILAVLNFTDPRWYSLNYAFLGAQTGILGINNMNHSHVATVQPVRHIFVVKGAARSVTGVRCKIVDFGLSDYVSSKEPNKTPTWALDGCGGTLSIAKLSPTVVFPSAGNSTSSMSVIIGIRYVAISSEHRVVSH